MSGRTSFDYIIVGGGSAGCVVAGRLAAAGVGTVLLLESGDPAEQNPETLTADGYKYAFANDRVMWDRFTEPQSHCGRRRLYAGTGRGTGGSGGVNAMVYTRGDRRDYAEWPTGWQWDDVVDDFEQLEAELDVHRRQPTRFTDACVQGATTTGFTEKEDLNDGDLCGFIGYEWMNYRDNERRNSYVAFVKDRDLPCLTIETNARTHRLLVQDGEVAGVEYVQRGTRQIVTANREVIVCAGALETPKILMLSGIGPQQHLEQVGVPVVSDQPEVGNNLHDHPNVALFFHGKNKADAKWPQLYAFHRANGDSNLPDGQADTCYVFWSAPASFYQAAERMLPPMMMPKGLYLKFPLFRHLIRRAIRFVLKLPPVRWFIDRMYGIVVILGKPKSRGRVRLRSADPTEPAAVDPAYYADPEDMDTMVAGFELARKVAGSVAMQDWGNRCLAPSAQWPVDKKIRKWIVGATMTTFHFAGTCRMGEDDQAPVDTRLNFRGLQGLRIADASVVPTVPVSAMNAPSMLIGFRAASYILEDYERGEFVQTEDRTAVS